MTTRLTTASSLVVVLWAWSTAHEGAMCPIEFGRMTEVSELPPVLIEEVPPIPSGSTVMLVGDSLAVGMSPKFRSIAGGCGYRTVVHAVSGSSTFQWTSWMKSDIEKHRPALVLVSLGTNDAMQLERAKKQDVYRKAIEALQGTRYVWILPHRIDVKKIPKIDGARDFIRRSVEHSFDSTKIDVPLAPDRIHTSGRGYDSWISGVWNELRDFGWVRCHWSSNHPSETTAASTSVFDPR